MGCPKKQNREPFRKSDRNCYYVQHGTNQLRLSPDKDEAWRLWHELMARKPEEPKTITWSSYAVVEVIDRFLDWCLKNRARPTYEAYQQRLQPLVDGIPPTLASGDLKPYHLTRIMDAKEGWGANRKSDFAGAVNRAYNWAIRQGLSTSNPVSNVEKPAREVREPTISPADYVEVMAKVTEPNFRLLLELAWETGARPQELRKIEARYHDPANQRIVFPPKEAKGKKYHRVIYLGSDRAKEIVAGQAKVHPEGAMIGPLLPPDPGGGRPRKTGMRDVLDAILHILRAGCQWRYLPGDLPPKSTARRYFNDWRRDGTLDRVHDHLRRKVRAAEKPYHPRASASVDSQSVDATSGGENRGRDNAKNVDGRKRHIVVDGMGLLLAVLVTAAAVDDAKGAAKLSARLGDQPMSRVRAMYAGSEYHTFTLHEWVRKKAGSDLSIVRRPKGSEGWVKLPIRWAVERTIEWLGRCRRLSKDREKTVVSSEAFLRLAMIQLMLHRLRPDETDAEFCYREVERSYIYLIIKQL